MAPQALWLPFEVTDVDAATDYYAKRLGLSIVDGWDRGGERGVVLAAGSAYVELVSAPVARAGPAAFQLNAAADVDRAFADWRPGAELRIGPHRYRRGHYGFEVAGPAGADVMVWSEK
ncbi:MAG TPA: VOC family protein [Pseudonocardiaceae bacterium]|jgi:catechol 2,3-dioxygenase-like lactoylglutathione lyase family enzyme